MYLDFVLTTHLSSMFVLTAPCIDMCASFSMRLLAASAQHSWLAPSQVY